MRFDLLTLFQLVSILAVCLWLTLSPSALTIVPAIFLISFFGTIRRKTALRGMLIGLSISVAYLIFYWMQLILDSPTTATRRGPPESTLEVFVLPVILFLFIFAPISAAIGGAAGALNEWIGSLQNRNERTNSAQDDV